MILIELERISTSSSFYLEPDVGMPEYLAQHYFKQVVSGMVGRCKRIEFIEISFYL